MRNVGGRVRLWSQEAAAGSSREPGAKLPTHLIQEFRLTPLQLYADGIALGLGSLGNERAIARVQC